MTAAVISIATLGVIRLPLAYLGAIKIGPKGVWTAFFISNIAGALIAYLWYQKGTWRQTVTDEDKVKGEVAEEAKGFGETITEKAENFLPDKILNSSNK